ncbi:hypothetical protein [Gloeothece verrucosa]|uniref:Uncharacterized protein n=1 Tax=Gloeothece verrucosa (strain PCC 7822) TaxID=497965 RepID=E0UNL9_GLOV7|nr:hypothetical protein [Gloeothece verrucosa]ADN18549.1 hypothetical protein Cyan7822_6905 [Gloeothece verrucosa PCC 7822]
MTYTLPAQNRSDQSVSLLKVDPLHKESNEFTYETQTVQVAGIPRIEYRTQPQEKTQICIGFTPAFHDGDYGYSQPKFVWGQEVAIASEYEKAIAAGTTSELNLYRIKAIQLVEPTIKVRGNERLSDEPYWLYGIVDRHCKHELRWFTEEELLHQSDLEAEIEPF